MRPFANSNSSVINGCRLPSTICQNSKRNGVTYFSSDYTCLTGLVYPKPLTPTNVVATDGTYPSYVKVTWAYPQGTDVTAFAIFRNATQIATVAGGIKEYYHLNVTTAGAYSVKAYKTASFQGSSYTNYSDVSNSDNGYTGQGAAANAFDITSTTASLGTLNGQTS